MLALDTLLLLEAFLYPLPVLLLLVATILTTSKNGRLPGPPVVAPRVAVILVAVAWMVVIGASAAYAQFVLAGNAIEQCFAGECPPERTVGAMAFMAAAATVTAVAVLLSLRKPTGMTRLGIIGAVAFACLTLLFPTTIMPSFVMPYYAFVPGFFYGVAAGAFLIVAVARKEEDPFQFATAQPTRTSPMSHTPSRNSARRRMCRFKRGCARSIPRSRELHSRWQGLSFLPRRRFEDVPSGSWSSGETCMRLHHLMRRRLRLESPSQLTCRTIAA